MKNLKATKLEDLKNRVASLEYYRKSEIETTGFVSGRTFNALAKYKKQLESELLKN